MSWSTSITPISNVTVKLLQVVQSGFDIQSMVKDRNHSWSKREKVKSIALTIFTILQSNDDVPRYWGHVFY